MIYFAALTTALWLGILTSISPCPLATNIAAVSFIARRLERPRGSLLSGLLYAFGRVIAYTSIGVLAVWGVLNIPNASQYLQEYSGNILGPILILVGMVLLDLIRIRLPSGSSLSRIEAKASLWGHPGSLVLGIVFALAFCPVSAALFFGALIPAAVNQNSAVLMPAVYGLGTGLPVVIFAVLFAMGLKKVGAIVDHLATVEIWARRTTGVIFIFIGIYYTLTHIFNVWQ